VNIFFQYPPVVYDHEKHHLHPGMELYTERICRYKIFLLLAATNALEPIERWGVSVLDAWDVFFGM